MLPEFIVSPKVTAGDKVAVVSLSFAAPGAFPAVHEVAMRRLRDEFGVEPVEYPTATAWRSRAWRRRCRGRHRHTGAA
ncbi:hypothetical protein [Micromonospora sp. CPCC 206061]|uniref:hypothetical protein n=1 Tax=Micromonospora sp. CPCC 206061 TaxID=3122410 RepID=UPI003FA59DA1